MQKNFRYDDSALGETTCIDLIKEGSRMNFQIANTKAELTLVGCIGQPSITVNLLFAIQCRIS